MKVKSKRRDLSSIDAGLSDRVIVSWKAAWVLEKVQSAEYKVQSKDGTLSDMAAWMADT